MRKLAVAALAGIAGACAQAQPAEQAKAAPPVVAFEVAAEPGVAQAVWATGLSHPWGIAWLPDGRALVTERGGALRIVGKDGKVGAPVQGVPAVAAVGQGGLLDVAVHPDFARNSYVYLTHSVGDPKANQTALSRGRLKGNALEDVTELFRNPQAKTGGAHFGSRLLWLPDGSLLMSVGDGGNTNIQLDGQPIRINAQNPKAYFGKVLRLTADGQPAPGNPGADAAKGWDARVWTMGHRNVQGLALDAKTGAVWATEHGARGGDELNRLTPGGNFGWPLVTYSMEYSGQPITEDRSRPGFQDPVSVWIPSIAASGLAVYRGSRLKSLDGALLAGGLMSQDVRVIRTGADGRPAGETRIQIGARVRDVAVGPDGLIYVLTDEDEGRIIRLSPAR
ncbi:PQQ-dependent sugar dehydrogenase [Sandaracinobacter neustonicus]|uniref:PQQ-dependent sugar dehydrogenase n=1 Tax=Sandaracinobacter neustonicus TaxID=1715348 RepID=A0A501XGZ3_9SPHN|nr:PQQ-dependent sugar dehydrogenase [Sandaracinobacter neustonicus]TPE59563.1 PQQ-dependent sugar dehydrogenase [Sandaracinobacter neustonicus]